MYKILAAIIVFAIPLIAGGLPLMFNKQDKVFAFPIGEALASGIFLGAGLIHMLHDAMDSAVAVHIPTVQVSLWVGSTFLFLLLLEHIGMYCREHFGKESNSIVLLAILILSIHALAAGIALGMTAQAKTIFVVLVAILSHKWAAGFALAMLLIKSTMPSKMCWVWYVFFCLMTPVGIYLGSVLLPWHGGYMAMVASAVAAGTFLYIGTLHGLKRAVLIDRCCDLKTFVWVLVGFVMMALIS